MPPAPLDASSTMEPPPPKQSTSTGGDPLDDAPKANSGILESATASATESDSSTNQKATGASDISEAVMKDHFKTDTPASIDHSAAVPGYYASKHITESTTAMKASNHGYSSDEDDYDDSRDHPLDDGPQDEESRLKREKRLAMNRASARERRRRKRVHMEELEQRVIQLTRQCVALQKTNENLQLYVAKLESDLTQANAAIAVLSKKEQAATTPRLPALEQPSLFAAARPNLAAAQAMEQERIRALLGMIQQQQQQDTAALANSARLPSAMGGNNFRKEDEMQRQVILGLLAAHQQQQLDTTEALGRGRPSAMDPSVASLLGAAVPPARASDPFSMYLSNLSRGNPPRMVNMQLVDGMNICTCFRLITHKNDTPFLSLQNDFAVPAHRLNEAALLAAIGADNARRLPNSASAPPPKKRRKQSDLEDY